MDSLGPVISVKGGRALGDPQSQAAGRGEGRQIDSRLEGTTVDRVDGYLERASTGDATLPHRHGPAMRDPPSEQAHTPVMAKAATPELTPPGVPWIVCARVSSPRP